MSKEWLGVKSKKLREWNEGQRRMMLEMYYVLGAMDVVDGVVRIDCDGMHIYDRRAKKWLD